MKKIIDLKFPIICSAIILVIAFVFTYIASISDYWLDRFNYIMFTPAIISVVIVLIQKKHPSKILLPLTQLPTIQSLIFAFTYPLIIIFFCAWVAQLLGFANVDWNLLPEKIQFHNFIQLVWAIGLVGGEEYGWRGYLLPEFEKFLGPIQSATVVGIIWAIWHGPLVYLLAYRMDTSQSPFLLACIQMFVVCVFSFPFAYVYFLSRSIIPPMVLHYMWNWFNPVVLGNIYRNTPGIAKGNILLINGEGFLGALIGVVFVIWYVFKFKKVMYPHAQR